MNIFYSRFIRLLSAAGCLQADSGAPPADCGCLPGPASARGDKARLHLPICVCSCCLGFTDGAAPLMCTRRPLRSRDNRARLVASGAFQPPNYTANTTPPLIARASCPSLHPARAIIVAQNDTNTFVSSVGRALPRVPPSQGDSRHPRRPAHAPKVVVGPDGITFGRMQPLLAVAPSVLTAEAKRMGCVCVCAHGCSPSFLLQRVRFAACWRPHHSLCPAPPPPWHGPGEKEE